MNKKITFVFAFFLPLFAFAQQSALIDTIVPVDEHDMIVYQEVLSVEGSPDVLYDRAEKWVKDYFPNPQGVFRKRDKTNGIITGNIRIRVYDYDKKGVKSNPAGVIHFDMKMEFKDGRYRITLDDFTRQMTSDFPIERWLDPEGKYFDEKKLIYVIQINEQVEAMIDSLEEAMMPPEAESDDW